MRTEKINASLETTLSRERLKKYLINQNDNLDAAIALYERNMQLSAAFYPDLQCLEVCLRNKIHLAMRENYSNAWLRDGGVPLESQARDGIETAWCDLDKPDAEKTSGDVIAELKFSFWVGLLAARYDDTIWRKALHKAFPNYKGKRSVVHGRMNAIRRFRNRMAHHEPIFHKDLRRMNAEISDAIGWMCADTKDWADHMSIVQKSLE